MTTVVFLPQVGELGDLLGDAVGVVRPEAEEDADVGILADRGLDVDLGLALVGAVLEDLEASCLASTRNGRPPRRRSPRGARWRWRRRPSRRRRRPCRPGAGASWPRGRRPRRPCGCSCRCRPGAASGWPSESIAITTLPAFWSSRILSAMPGRVGLDHRDGHALDVGQAERRPRAAGSARPGRPRCAASRPGP